MESKSIQDIYYRNESVFDVVISQIVADDNFKLGESWFLQCFEIKDGEDKGNYVLGLKLNKVSLSRINWEIVTLHQVEDEQWEALKKDVEMMGKELEKKYKVIDGN